MSQPGLGAMIHYLSGGSANSADKYYGRKITDAQLDKGADRLRLVFSDGTKIAIWDDGQSCCESRYITCDDDVSRIVGGELLSITTKDAPDIDGEYGSVHEQVFVDITSTNGTVTMTTHNEHNGYYGGFGLTITEDA